MKPLNVSKNIVSLSEFKAKASQMLYEVQSTHHPIVITQNGKAAAVLISPEAFDFLTEQARFIDAVQKGLADVEKGRVVADENAGEDEQREG
ncbi:type II toxin-antitoxin system Phd/YefM family antitoxin [Desulfococcus sp.]|uniref:type II toxin-antitoxin system Phd/YefM family antitoxin n=1 Tax=Desulfococcus sp. TaxID=2025834 RepID=UPI0035940D9F